MPRGTKSQPSEFTKYIADYISTFMEDNEIKKLPFSKIVGISRPQLVNMLQGKKHWDIDSLKAVCDALGIDIVKLVDLAERANNAPPRLTVIEGGNNGSFDFDNRVDIDIAATDMPDTGEPITP
jgi:DNA-binding Xre family transcriptional regulator